MEALLRSTADTPLEISYNQRYAFTLKVFKSMDLVPARMDVDAVIFC